MGLEVILLKGLMRRVDRFCALHPRFGVKNLMLYIVIGNLLVYLFTIMDSTGTLTETLEFSAAGVLHGQLWRLITFVLVPGGGHPILVALMLYFYYFIGRTVEQQWGQAKFTVFYLSGMLFLIVFGLLVYAFTGISNTFPGSLLNLGLFFAFATFFPDQQVLLLLFIPIKVKWLALIDLAYFVFYFITWPFPEKLLPVVILLHYVVFCGGWLIDYIRPARVKQRAKTVSFKREAERIRREQASQPYRFKCAVCGRTDVSNPELEFRYCSRCAGYHCFCMDHINNHVHFTE